MLSKLFSLISSSNVSPNVETSTNVSTNVTTSVQQAEAVKQQQYKIVITGDGGVGKTSFVNKLGKDHFFRTYIPTMGVNVVSLLVKTQHKSYVLNMWDTAGQEKFGGLRDAYYRGCDACLILFGSDDKSTYKNVAAWYREISRVCEDIPIVLAGTKSDVLAKQGNKSFTNSNKVSSYCSTKKNLFFSCFFSSKTGENLFHPIELLLSKLENDTDLKVLDIQVI